MVCARTGGKGFTMIELLIVIVLVAIVAALAAPAISGTMAKQRLYSATQDVLQALQFARFQAVLRGRAQVVEIELADDAPGGAVRIYETTSAACNNRLPEVKREVLFDAWDTGDVGLVAAAPAGVENSGICFKPDGKVYDASSALPPRMGGDELRAYNVPRASSFAMRFRRYDSEDGGVVSVGVRKELLLPHLGIARLSQELAAGFEE